MRGKNYTDSVKEFDKDAKYEIEEAVSIVKKSAKANLMRQLSFTSELVVMVVTQNSRSVVPLYYQTVQVKMLRF